jgi:prefoldin subunit 5
MTSLEGLARKGQIQELKETIDTLDTRITSYASAIRLAMPYACKPEEIDIRVVRENTRQLESALKEYNEAKEQLKKLEEA